MENPWIIYGLWSVYPLVMTNSSLWKITTLNGKIHYKWSITLWKINELNGPILISYVQLPEGIQWVGWFSSMVYKFDELVGKCGRKLAGYHEVPFEWKMESCSLKVNGLHGLIWNSTRSTDRQPATVDTVYNK